MGERFGEYELLRKIATGGMAEIYLARAFGLEGFSRRVVVKRMLPQLAVRPDFVQMFLDEARLAAGLVHPNIVQVFNLGEVEGNYFMAMELIDGPHLGALFAHSLRQRRPLPIELCVYVVARAADGLHYAHDHSDPATGQPLHIVHRDISPQNILVSKHGDVKVLDFGVAKAETQQTKTRTGIIKGKVSYMSPEQCLGDTVDRRTDVFALGVVLYELITRRRLFRDKSDLLIMQRITTEDVPPPSTINPVVDKELDKIALKALARNKEERYATAGDLSEALDTWLALKGHADCRAQLQRWMAANAEGLGIGSFEEAGEQSTPSWERDIKSRPGAGEPAAKEPDEGTVSTPALNAQGGTAGLPGTEAQGDPQASGATLVVPASVVEEAQAAEADVPSATDADDTARNPLEPDPELAQEPTLVSPPPAAGVKASIADVDIPAAPRARLPVAALAGGGAALLLAVVVGGVVLGLEESTSAPPPDGTGAVTSVPLPSPPKPAEAPPAKEPPAPEEPVASPSAEVALRIETTPEGVPVYIDGEEVGTSPVDVPRAPGTVRVEARFEGQPPIAREVSLAEGAPATVKLVAKARLSVRSRPEGAEVQLDGRSVGTTPIEELWLEPGKPAKITVAKSGYQRLVKTLTPEPGQALLVDEPLAKAPVSRPSRPPRSARSSQPSQPVGTGKLIVNSHPWADVYVDGQHKGITPTTTPPIELLAGYHRVKVVNKKLGFSKSTRVLVQRNATVKIGFRFKKEGDRYVFDTIVQ